jgi:hypothetical protein
VIIENEKVKYCIQCSLREHVTLRNEFDGTAVTIDTKDMIAIATMILESADRDLKYYKKEYKKGSDNG